MACRTRGVGLPDKLPFSGFVHRVKAFITLAYLSQ